MTTQYGFFKWIAGFATTFTIINFIGLHYEYKLLLNKRNKKMNGFYIGSALKLHHIVFQQQLNEDNLQNLEQCISQTVYFGYSSLTIDNPYLTESYKKMREREFALHFYCLLLPRANSSIFLVHAFRHLASAILYIMLILSRILQPSQLEYAATEFAPFAMFVLLDLLTGWMLVLAATFILGFLIFLPLYLFIEVCFRMPKYVRRIKRKLLGRSQRFVFSVDQECSICLTPMKENQKIQVLECSERHIFHLQCISQWLVYHRECPLCRSRVESDIVVQMQQIG